MYGRSWPQADRPQPSKTPRIADLRPGAEKLLSPARFPREDVTEWRVLSRIGLSDLRPEDPFLAKWRIGGCGDIPIVAIATMDPSIVRSMIEASISLPMN